jgi:hypothetical protein
MWFMQHIDADKTFSDSYVSNCVQLHRQPLIEPVRQSAIQRRQHRLSVQTALNSHAKQLCAVHYKRKGVLGVLKTAFTRAKELRIILLRYENLIGLN